MDAADESFLAAFGAIRFIEIAYRTPGAHVATYGPMEVIPLRAAVLAALADAGSTAPSMPAEWADEVLVRARPDALHAVLSRWLARCLRVHREVVLSFHEDPAGAHLTLRAPDARAVFELVQRIERPMLMALARAAGALEPPAAPSPDTLMVLSFARA